MSDDHPLLDDLTLVEKDENWIDRELQNHYGSDRWHEPASRGIFHQNSDSVWRLPDSKRAILQRAKILSERPEPDGTTDKYDCEDYSFALYSALTMAYPRLSVGIAINLSGSHVWNVFVTSDGEVIDFEPQSGRDVSDSYRDRYDFKRGILIF
jgi:hypothetical protein